MRAPDRERRSCRRKAAQRRARERRSTSARSYLEHLLGYVDARQAQAAEGGGQCRQRRRGPDRRSARAAPAVRVHQDQPRARRHVSRTACPIPMLEENRAATARAGAPQRAPTWAWPGTATTTAASSSMSSGQFIEGYYLVGLLAEAFLQRRARRAHRARPAPDLEYASISCSRCGGEPVLCKSGHAFIKQKMREVDAAYGGEMSAHHYFRDFAYCDSGMIPWLLVLRGDQRVAASRSRSWWASACGCSRPAARSTAQLPMRRARRSWRACAQHYERAGAARSTSPTGCRWSSTQWRFNLRGSNTEPLVRLNVESRGDRGADAGQDRRAAAADRRLRAAPWDAPPVVQIPILPRRRTSLATTRKVQLLRDACARLHDARTSAAHTRCRLWQRLRGNSLPRRATRRGVRDRSLCTQH